MYLAIHKYMPCMYVVPSNSLAALNHMCSVEGPAPGMVAIYLSGDVLVILYCSMIASIIRLQVRVGFVAVS